MTGLLAVTLAATLVSPFGYRSWECVWILARFLREAHLDVTEFAPPTGRLLTLWTVKLFWVTWAATILAIIRTVVRGRRPLFALLLAIPGLWLSATSYRSIPLFILFCAPLWRSVVDGGRRTPSRPASRRRRRLAVAIPTLITALALALAAWVVSGGYYRSLRSEAGFGFGLPPHAYPVHVRDYLSRHPFEGRIFNNPSDGGYLEYAFPDLRIYIDSRYTDAAVVREYFESLTSPEAFARLNAREHFDAALLKVTDNGVLLKSLMTSGDWAIACADLHRVFMVDRRSAAGSRAPIEAPRFYRGEDLSRRVNGLPAIQWINLLVQTDRRELLLAALDAFQVAPRIPSFVIEYALRYAIPRRDMDVADRAQAMAPRMVALDPSHRASVEQLLRLVPAAPDGQ